MGLEPTTSTLPVWHSPAELHPQRNIYYHGFFNFATRNLMVFVSSNRWQLFFVFQNDIFYLILGSPNKPLLAFFYQ